MNLVKEIAERQRQAQTGDSWFVTSQPYVLELRTARGARIGPRASQGQAFMVLPLAPEGYKVRRVYRQAVTPTLGGLVAEERGLLWREIMVRGSFGLEPKFTQDTSSDQDNQGSTLSGPLWTRRMVRNFFNKYAELKANPQFAAETKLIWHDVKTDDHWVVVPADLDVDRNSSRRFQYPYAFNLKAIANADAITVSSPTASLLSETRDAIGQARRDVATVSAAIQEGSRILGEIRFTASQIDSVIDATTTVIRSTEDFVNGVTDTISVGRTFVSSAAQQFDAVLSLMETSANLPNAVRQNYLQAQDGLHAIVANAGAFGVSYEQQVAAIRQAELGAVGDTRVDLDAAAAAGPPGSADELANQRIASTDRSLVDAGATAQGRVFGSYNSIIEYAVRGGDSLQGLAGRFLGDGALWYDIAVLNDLKPPYISPVGGRGVAAPGTIIAIPQVVDQTAVAVAGSTAGSNPGANRLGTDILLFETGTSRPGRPSVDIAIDFRTRRDVRTVSREANLAQALQLRTWTERGRLPYAPGYGLPRTIGIAQNEAFATLLQLSHRETIMQDPRVDAIQSYQFDAEGDVVEVDLSVIPVGATSAQAITTSLV